MIYNGRGLCRVALCDSETQSINHQSFQYLINTPNHSDPFTHLTHEYSMSQHNRLNVNDNNRLACCVWFDCVARDMGWPCHRPPSHPIAIYPIRHNFLKLRCRHPPIPFLKSRYGRRSLSKTQARIRSSLR